MKLIFITLLFVLGLLQYEFWFSEGGMKTVFELKKKISDQTQINDALAKKNDALEKDIQRLSTHKNAIESNARNDLGMIKKNEVYYQVVG